MNTSKLKAQLIRLVILAFSKLPFSWSQYFGLLVGKIIWLTKPKTVHISNMNLKHCYPELNQQERDKLSKECIEHTCMTAAEMGALWCWPLSKVLSLIKEVEGEQLLLEADERKQGLILLSPHIGNWEVIGPYLAKRFSLSILYQPPKINELDAFVKGVRSRTGAGLVPTNKRGVIRLFQILREKGVIGILPDQEPETSGGVFAPFFGVQANTIKLVSKLIEKTGARALCISSIRLDKGRGYKLVVREVNPKLYSEDLIESVTGLNLTVEDAVSLAPSQYQWVYKRFKRRPDGSRHFYD